MSGRICKGSDAVSQAKLDAQNQGSSSRYELELLVDAARQNFCKLVSGTGTGAIAAGSEAESSTATEEAMYDMSFWGFPQKTLKRYRLDKVKRLFDWQVECLVKHPQALLQGQNLIYSAPTSGGKTLVSEILMLWRIAQNKGTTCLYIVPFVALAEEKAKYFQNKWQDLNIGVRCYHGDSEGNSDLTGDVSLAVCTIEKANILINELIGAGHEDQISMIIVDEIHLLDDSYRGFLIEVLLSKISFLTPQVQIVGMSATLPNLKELGEWLQAAVHLTDYRPVPLEIKICAVNSNTKSAQIMARNDYSTLPSWNQAEYAARFPETFRPIRVINLTPPQPLSIDGALHHLVEETTRDGKSVIVFCNTKVWCETVAFKWANRKELQQQTQQQTQQQQQQQQQQRKQHLNTEISPLEKAAAKGMRDLASHKKEAAAQGMDDVAMNNQHPMESIIQRKRYLLLDDLNNLQGGLCPTLKLTVPFGCAYHHAGLSGEERKLIENAFSQGTITVLCATSTLAAGVNLPANRVIVRSTSMGKAKLSVASFKQMCGRAGRMNLDSVGDAILMVQESSGEDKAKAVELVCGDVVPLRSQLHLGKGGGLEKLLLETIYLSIKNENVTQLANSGDIDRFLQCTLLSVQFSDKELQGWGANAMKYLRQGKLVGQVHDIHHARAQESSKMDVQSNTTQLSKILLTPVGVAAVLSGVAPKDCVTNIQELLGARDRLILQTGLHCLFLVTPPFSNLSVKWTSYDDIYDKLCRKYPDVDKVAKYIGISRARLQSYMTNPPNISTESNWTNENKLDKRFYSTIVLFCVLQERPLDSIIEEMNISRGDLRALLHDSSMFCRTTVTFCQHMQWKSLAAILGTYSNLLSFGVPDHLLPLARLGNDLVPAHRARLLFNNGIRNAEGLIEMKEESIANILYSGLSHESSKVENAGFQRPGHKSITDAKVRGEEVEAVLTFSSCMRTAQKLRQRAQQTVHEELTLATKLVEEGVL